jgi:hypothetical protein
MGISCTLSLTGGSGNISFNVVVGPNCLLGQSCGFPAGYVGTSFAYKMPDGSSASTPDFSGVMTYLGTASCGTGCSAYYYTIKGTFSGQDSQGRTFSGSTQQSLTLSSHFHGADSALDTGGATTLTYTGTAAQSSPSPTAPDFSLTVSQTTLTVSPGQSAVVSLTLIPVAGFAGTQTFSCSGLPTSANCSFNPPSLTLDGSNNPLTTQMTITTGTATASAMPKQNESHLPPGYSFFAVLLPAAFLCSDNRKANKATLRI